MLATVGDLLEDIVVRMLEPLRPASDTTSHITRRRGGSAANVASAAARAGGPARFIGRVGADRLGRLLVDELAADGVDTTAVQFVGDTGCIAVIVDDRGERTMLTDRRACLGLDDPRPEWLDGVNVLHLPLYSLAPSPLADTSRWLAGEARRRSIPVSLDLSSTALVEQLGLTVVERAIASLEPAVVFANDDEASAVGIDGPVGRALTIVKRGAEPAIVHRPGHRPTAVPARTLPPGTDSTGAGDAFAAGFLSHDGWAHDPEAATERAHDVAATAISHR